MILTSPFTSIYCVHLPSQCPTSKCNCFNLILNYLICPFKCYQISNSIQQSCNTSYILCSEVHIQHIMQFNNSALKYINFLRPPHKVQRDDSEKKVLRDHSEIISLILKDRMMKLRRKTLEFQ